MSGCVSDLVDLSGPKTCVPTNISIQDKKFDPSSDMLTAAHHYFINTIIVIISPNIGAPHAKLEATSIGVNILTDMLCTHARKDSLMGCSLSTLMFCRVSVHVPVLAYIQCMWNTYLYAYIHRYLLGKCVNVAIPFEDVRGVTGIESRHLIHSHQAQHTSRYGSNKSSICRANCRIRREKLQE